MTEKVNTTYIAVVISIASNFAISRVTTTEELGHWKEDSGRGETLVEELSRWWSSRGRPETFKAGVLLSLFGGDVCRV